MTPSVYISPYPCVWVLILFIVYLYRTLHTSVSVSITSEWTIFGTTEVSSIYTDYDLCIFGLL